MALFKPLMGDSTRLDAQEFHSGYAYLTTNDENFYIDAIDDNGNQKRIHINKKQVPDWNVNDYEAEGYIKNRPFYEEAYTYNVFHAEAVEMIDSGRTTSDGSPIYVYTGISGELIIYQYHDYIIETETETRQATCAAWDYKAYIGNGSLAFDGVEDTGEPFCFTFDYNTNYAFYSIDPATKEFVTVKATGTNTHTIDPKFLPYEATANADWNAPQGTVGHIINKPFYSELYETELFTISDIVLDSEFLYDDYVVYLAMGSMDSQMITPDTDYTIKTDFDNQYLRSYSYGDEGTVAIGNLWLMDNANADTYEPFLFIMNTDGTWEFYANNNYTTYVTVSLAEEVICQIDEKFIPDNIKLPSDWATNDPSDPTYIQNRTHYDEYSEEEWYTFSGLNLTEETIAVDGSTPLYFTTGNDPMFAPEVDSSYIVQFPEYWVNDLCFQYDEETYYMGNIGFINTELGDTGEPFFITYNINTGDYTFYSTMSGEIGDVPIYFVRQGVVQLDERFIPNTIARTEELNNVIAKGITEINFSQDAYVWIGTKEEYEAIDEPVTNCLYIVTDGESEAITFEDVSNKVTEINDNADNVSYPTTLAVKNYMSNISGYEKTINKVTTISNASTDEGYTSPLSVYTLVQNEVNAAKTAVLQTVEDRVNGVEKTTNKTTVVNADSKHTEYPTAKAVMTAIEEFATGTDIETTDTIDENSTADTIPNTKAVYDFVVNHTPELPDTIPTVYTGTSEPDASTGKVGDLFIIV